MDWSHCSEALSSLRHVVFVEEQGVPLELELDGEDPDAHHAAAFSDDGEVIGTGRLLESGKIGRMAVRQPLRRRGIGLALLLALMEEARRAVGRNIQAEMVDQERAKLKQARQAPKKMKKVQILHV